jgi:hypothetical protein
MDSHSLIKWTVLASSNVYRRPEGRKLLKDVCRLKPLRLRIADMTVATCYNFCLRPNFQIQFSATSRSPGCHRDQGKRLSNTQCLSDRVYKMSLSMQDSDRYEPLCELFISSHLAEFKLEFDFGVGSVYRYRFRERGGDRAKSPDYQR